MYSLEKLKTYFMNWVMRAHNQQAWLLRISMSKVSCEHIVAAHIFKFRCIEKSRRIKILFSRKFLFKIHLLNSESFNRTWLNSVWFNPKSKLWSFIIDVIRFSPERTHQRYFHVYFPIYWLNYNSFSNIVFFFSKKKILLMIKNLIEITKMRWKTTVVILTISQII